MGSKYLWMHDLFSIQMQCAHQGLFLLYWWAVLNTSLARVNMHAWMATQLPTFDQWHTSRFYTLPWLLWQPLLRDRLPPTHLWELLQGYGWHVAVLLGSFPVHRLSGQSGRVSCASSDRPSQLAMRALHRLLKARRQMVSRQWLSSQSCAHVRLAWLAVHSSLGKN